MLTAFKDFVNKANMVDLAVAVVIGAAFGKLVDAVVSLVIAIVVFLIVRAIESMKRQEEAKAADAGPDPQVELAATSTRLAEALDRRGL